MSLIKCPECELQVSDRALSCPHCGYPMDKKGIQRKRPKKRMRLPNGFGSITEIKNKNVRNPFFVRVTVGKNEFGRPIQKSLKPQAYFETWNDAYAALLEYQKNPYDLDQDITVKQLYDKWTDFYFEQLTSDSSTRTITAAWAYCSSLYNMRAKDVRARHIKGCMEDGYRIETKGKRKGEKIFASAGVKARIKSMFNLMFDYALEYEIVDKNYARTFDISDDIIKEKEQNKRGHIVFTESESEILWKNLNKIKYVDWILIQEYMGWRPQELATLRLDEINFEKWYMQAGMKTDAGKQRIVPIHSRIRPLVQTNYEFALSIGSKYLFNDKGQTHGSWKITYDKYANRFKKVIDVLNLNPLHRPHDPRKTFVTRAKKAGMDEYAIKLIVGHKIEDITEATYTDRDIEWLRQDIEKIE
ncbi:tyrosine-type recombinase/integrase [Frisingicoccus sp.]|uniref:tyrosine-type recombinase/integrase n=1 Tax=Frisingicoccus sp. TaxID=1918627 RepID=UPI003AB4414B